MACYVLFDQPYLAILVHHRPSKRLRDVTQVDHAMIFLPQLGSPMTSASTDRWWSFGVVGHFGLMDMEVSEEILNESSYSSTLTSPTTSPTFPMAMLLKPYI
ncbi:hypothetical protein AB3S75_014951 [Citrus x aurantiifolia]